MFVPVLSRFLQWLPVGLVSPVLSLLFLSRGISLAELGVLWMVYATTVVVLELPTGIFADLAGRRTTFLLSLAVGCLSYALLIPARGLVPLLTAAMLMAGSRALSSGSIEALFIDRYLERHGADRLQLITAAFAVAEPAALALGALAGGFLPLLWACLFPASDRYAGNLWAMLLISLIHAVLVVFAVPGDRPPEGMPRKAVLPFLRESVSCLRSNPILPLLLWGFMAWGFCFQSIEVFWQPRLKTILGSADRTWIFGLLSSGYFLSGMLGSAASVLLARRWGLSSFATVAAGRFFCAALIAGLAFRNGVAGFAVFYLGMFVFNGAAGPYESAILNQEVPSAQRATMLSLSSLAVQAGGGLGSLALGFAAQRWSIPAAWLMGATVLAASAGLFLRGGRYRASR